MKEDICRRIKMIRIRLNMNKCEFAKFLDISPQYLGSVESGENCLSVEKIILLSRKTNISTDYILLGKDEIIDEKMIKEITKLNEKQLDSCFLLIKNIIELTKESAWFYFLKIYF